MAIIDLDTGQPVGRGRVVDLDAPDTSKASVADYGRATMSGFAGIAEAAGKGIRYAGAESAGKWLQTLGNEAAQSWVGWMTPAGQKALGNEIITDDFKVGETPWQSLGLQAAMSLPSMIATVPVGGPIAGGIAKLGGEALAALATRPGTLGFLARVMPTSLGYGAAEGGISALQNAAQTETDVLNTPLETLQQHPNFQRLYAQTDPSLPEKERLDQARQATARLASDEVAWKTFVSTGGIGALTGGGALGGAHRAVERGAKGIIGGALKGAGEEFIQEAPQSGAEQYIQNIAKQKYYDAGTDPTKGVVSAALSGGAVGGLTGAVAGGAGRVIDSTSRRVDDSEQQTAAAVTRVSQAGTVDEAIAAAVAATAPAVPASPAETGTAPLVPPVNVPPAADSTGPLGITTTGVSSDQENLAGLPGQEQVGAQPLQGKPLEGGSGEAAATGGAVQAAGLDRAGDAVVGTPVDQQAHEAATSPLNDRPEPTDFQKDAGNYKLGHVNVGGLDISVENPAGSIRRSKADAPKPWQIEMQQHYGYVKGVPAKGADKDHVDVFVKPGTPDGFTGNVWVVDQNRTDGKFDENKTMVGYGSEQEAKAAYLSSYEPGWEKRIRGITQLSMEQFKARLQDPGGFLKPLAAEAPKPEFYQWKRNAQSGQTYGNRQRIEPLTPALFDQYIKPRVKVSLRDFNAWRTANKTATHINLIEREDGRVVPGSPFVGSLEQLRPAGDAVQKGGAVKVDSFEDVTARKHGASAEQVDQVLGRPISELSDKELQFAAKQASAVVRKSIENEITARRRVGEPAAAAPSKTVTILGKPVDKLSDEVLTFASKSGSADVQTSAREELSRRAKAKQAGIAKQRQVNPAVGSMFAAIGKLGGINKDKAIAEWGLDPKDRLQSGVIGMPVLRVDGGFSLDEMAKLLAQYGYLETDADGKITLTDFETAFDRELRGEPVMAAQGHEAKAAARQSDLEAQAQEEADRGVAAIEAKVGNDWAIMTDEDKDAELDDIFGSDTRPGAAPATGTAAGASARPQGAGQKVSGEGAVGGTATISERARPDSGGRTSDSSGIVAEGQRNLRGSEQAGREENAGTGVVGDQRPDQLQRPAEQRRDGVEAPPAAPATTQAPADAGVSASGADITDFGEKIGGARKDTAQPTGTRVMLTEEESEEPGWRKRFTVAQRPGQIPETWFIVDKRTNKPMRRGYSTMEFQTEQAALDAIPLAAVAMKHRVVQVSATKDAIAKHEIWRDVTDRKRVKVVDQQFDSREDAMRYMAQHAVEIIETKTGFGEEILAKPEKVMRNGVERRTGPATAPMFTDTFGFRGVEFGNWNNQAERQEVMNHAYDGLLDLAEVLNVLPKALSLNGDLALAFGARGQGLTGARAHYERDYGVINLTKMTGAGALAHEWFHATDHYFARQDTKAKPERVRNESGDLVYPASSRSNDYASYGFKAAGSGVRPEVREAYESLIKTMFTKAEQYVEDTEKAEKFVGGARARLSEALKEIRADLLRGPDTLTHMKRNNKPAAAEQLAAFDVLAEKLIAGQDLETSFRYNKTDGGPANRRGAMAGRWSTDTLDAISAILKSVRGRSGFSSERSGRLDGLVYLMKVYRERIAMLESANSQETKTKRVPTSYAMDAKRIDQGRATDYWTTEHEMAARAFSAYVEDKIAASGNRSDFLSYGSDNNLPNYRILNVRPFPEGAERLAIDAAFDNLFKTLQTKEEAGRVGLFSRAGGRDRTITKIGRAGLPIFGNNNIALDRPRRYGEDKGVLVYSLFDPQKVREARQAGRPDAEGMVGHVELDVSPDGKITGLSGIFINNDLRTQRRANQGLERFGYGEKVIRAILSTLPPGAELKIFGILPEARGFWEKMGTTTQPGRFTEDGYVTRASYEQKRTPIDDGGGTSGLVFSRRARGTASETDAGGRSRREAGPDQSSGRDRQPEITGRQSPDEAPLSAGLFLSDVASVQREIGVEVGNKTSKVHVVQSWQSLPDDARELVFSRRAFDVQGYMDKDTGDAWLIADNIRSGESFSVLMHEAGVHMGLEKFIGSENVTRLANQIRAWSTGRGSAEHFGLARDAVAKVPADTPVDERDQEIIAYFVEEAVKAGHGAPKPADTGPVARWFRQLWSAVRDAVRKLGADPASMTTDDVVALARGSLERALGGNNQTDTPAFKKWFGDSKVVDDDGKPLVVYHGTVSSVQIGKFRMPAYFTESAEFAGRFARQHTGKDEKGVFQYDPENPRRGAPAIYPAYLSIKNPHVINGRIEGRHFEWDADEIAALKKKGHDGIINEHPDGNIYTPFAQSQIKSSTGNRGTFDQKSPNILMSRRGEAAAAQPPERARITDQAQTFIRDLLTSDRRFGFWHRTVGTQQHKAMVNREFKKVYDESQRFIGDVSRYANESADLASDLLPRIEGFKDFFKKAPSKADVNAVGNALMQGTLFGGGSPMDGRLWTDEELRTGRLEGHNLQVFEPMTEKQIGLYRQALSAINHSLDEFGKSMVYRYARTHDIAFDREKALADIVAEVTDAIDTKTEEAKMRRDVLAEQVTEAEADVDAEYDRHNPEARLQHNRAMTKRDDLQKQHAAAEQSIAELEATRTAIEDVQSKITGLQEHGYFPAMRFGQFAVYVTRGSAERGDLEQVHFSLYDTQREANKAARELAAQYPGADITKGMVSQEKHKLFQGLSLDALETFAEHMEIDADPIVQGFLRAATSQRSALKRQIHRSGLAGFTDDISRVLAQFVVSTARATSGGYHNANMLKAANDIKAGDVQDEAVKLVRYLMDPAEEASALRGFMFFNFIGGSIAHGIVNLTQPMMVTAPYLSQHTSYAKAVAQLVRAMKEVSHGAPMPRGLKEAVDRAKKEGIVSPQEIHQLRAEAGPSLAGRSLLLRKLTHLWGSIYSVTEQFNRETTFIAAYRIGADKGIEDPYQFAVDAVNETQFVYNKGSRPNWARGPVGATVMTFKQFSISYLELMKRLYDKDKKAFAIMVMTLMFAAGAEGLPFAEDAEDLIDTIGQWLGYGTNSKKALRRFATNLLGKDLADYALHGISAGLPVDVSVRLGMQNLIPGTSMLNPSEKNKARDVVELLGPAGQFVPVEGTTMGRMIERLSKGDLFGAAKSGSPVAVKNFLTGYEMATTGEARDGTGKKITDVSAGDAVAKMVGLQPSKVAAASERVGEVMKDINIQRTKEAEIAEKWARGIHEKDHDVIDQARQDLRDWNAKNPDMRIVIKPQQIQSRVRDMQRTRDERFVKRAPPEIRSDVRERLRQP